MTCQEAIESAYELIEHLRRPPMASYTGNEVAVMIECLIGIIGG
jgi:hypothetical protein